MPDQRVACLLLHCSHRLVAKARVGKRTKQAIPATYNAPRLRCQGTENYTKVTVSAVGRASHGDGSVHHGQPCRPPASACISLVKLEMGSSRPFVYWRKFCGLAAQVILCVAALSGYFSPRLAPPATSRRQRCR